MLTLLAYLSALIISGLLCLLLKKLASTINFFKIIIYLAFLVFLIGKASRLRDEYEFGQMSWIQFTLTLALGIFGFIFVGFIIFSKWEDGNE